MTHTKVLSQGNIPAFSSHQNQNQNPALSKFRDFQALALHSPSIYQTQTTHFSQFDVVSKIPPPPCRLPPRAASAKEEDDPFLVAYRECTKSVKNGKFVGNRGNKGVFGAVKKSKFFGFSCKSINSCDITDNSFFKLPRDTIHVSTWK